MNTPEFMTIEGIINTIDDLNDEGIVELTEGLAQLPLTNETPGTSRSDLFDGFIYTIRKFHEMEVSSPPTMAAEIDLLVSSAVNQGQTLSIDQIRAITKNHILEQTKRGFYPDASFEECHYYEDSQWYVKFSYEDGSSNTYGED